MAKSKDELDEELCNYCPLTDYGLTKINNAPYNQCEGIRCDLTYKEYLENFEEEEE
ncbi:hypothetical protein [Clostridium cellulovorans]|jgi:hypothetical protein|uniref:Uncharacterized protein n=1 Tax=Clostridium cellulovorans (strain ATCC 35296 / DSM 3052 / OCM 3 / 743B) TaxID=573061 RepID=D9SWG1_CLOC7|nr:hypothetical protein [Clostridium cellulovorans]ADL53243.1 hypothetical protein Clocel_3567 [Clostridium cellulovorans 743B]